MPIDLEPGTQLPQSRRSSTLASGSSEKVAVASAAASGSTAVEKGSAFSVPLPDFVAPPTPPPEDPDGDGGTTPVEGASPLGYDFGFMSAFLLNISQMIGSGIYATPGFILESLGSVGFCLVLWAIGALFAFASLAVMIELAARHPRQSGAEVAYYASVFPRPKFLAPITFAITTLVLSFTTTNALVVAEYSITACGRELTEFNQRAVAVLTVSVCSLLCCLSTKWSLRLNNVICAVKVVVLLFIIATGAAILMGVAKERLGLAQHNFKNAFEGSTHNGNLIAVSAVKVNFGYNGWASSNSVVGEMTGNSSRVVRQAGFAALAAVACLYIGTNIAFFAAVSKEELISSGTLVGSMFFKRVFGSTAAVRGLPALIAISAVGQILADLLSQLRMMREIGRMGAMPWPKFWSSTWPLGTPGGPSLIKWAVSVVLLVAIPTHGTFNFLIDLASYPSLLFGFLSAVAIYLLRYRHRGEERPPFMAWHSAIIFSLLGSVFFVVTPWVPPEPGKGQYTMWYGLYCVVGIGILLFCGLYWALAMKLIPRWRGYKLNAHHLTLANGEKLTVLVKVRPGDEEGADTAVG